LSRRSTLRHPALRLAAGQAASTDFSRLELFSSFMLKSQAQNAYNEYRQALEIYQTIARSAK